LDLSLLELGLSRWEGCTLGAEKIFCGESSTFLFAFQVLFLVLYGVLSAVRWFFVVCFNIVCGAILHGLWCGLMLVFLAIEYVEGLCGKRNFKRRRQLTPYTFFYHVAGRFGQL